MLMRTSDGLFSVQNKQDPVSVKSRTGYVITYRGAPLMWASKMQTQVALSTMEAKYIALSQSMRDLIPIREVLKEIMTIVFNKEPNITYHSHTPRRLMIRLAQHHMSFHSRQCMKTTMHA